jgi:hypothetical protein
VAALQSYDQAGGRRRALPAICVAREIGFCSNRWLWFQFNGIIEHVSRIYIQTAQSGMRWNFSSGVEHQSSVKAREHFILCIFKATHKFAMRPGESYKKYLTCNASNWKVVFRGDAMLRSSVSESAYIKKYFNVFWSQRRMGCFSPFRASLPDGISGICKKAGISETDQSQRNVSFARLLTNIREIHFYPLHLYNIYIVCLKHMISGLSALITNI